ncbi:protein of unknown function DUF89 [Gloeothece citriformis PCC 7424]|uniref:Damage-control phosphatase ARMT1-like metal-binding domain-containing protein n=1 Tax=Gloeothece citriformis (strain PCC 7424) TaxID=65393 RepID=B7KE20_GLOC7|nr:damage-control phosphatase ARMT1 family protein [Gloeothece citriformis]ACK71718.1 protein of unknown function DUF89 [Gloeothece citriformis PCC 7424]
MAQVNLPHLPIPKPLIVSEEGSFAYYTFTHRIPLMIERVMAENDYSDAILENLKELSVDVLNGLIRPIKNDGGGDILAWDEYVKPYLGKRWIDTPFYFAETYFYRRLLEATDYFLIPISERVDPFKPQKYGSLESVMNSVCLIAKQVTQLQEIYSHRDSQWQERLINLLYGTLWGNRADLSLNPTEAGKFQHQETEQDIDHILLNDSGKIAEKFKNIEGDRLDFIVDNAGFELISDLFLMDFLLTANVAQNFYIHVKSYPIFVSDATRQDIQLTLEFLANYSDPDVRKFADRLLSYQKNHRLQVFDDFFWTSPLFFWEMPQLLRDNLAQSELVLIKGDANYRRLVGDCHWDKTSSFSNIVCYFPTNLVTFRTLKSEVMVGLSQEQIESVKAKDSTWLIDGKWGIIQLYENINH